MLLGVPANWLSKAFLSLSAHQATTQWTPNHECCWSCSCDTPGSAPPSCTCPCCPFFSWPARSEEDTHHIKSSETKASHAAKCRYTKATCSTHPLSCSHKQADVSTPATSDDQDSPVLWPSTTSRDGTADASRQGIPAHTFRGSSGIWQRYGPEKSTSSTDSPGRNWLVPIFQTMRQNTKLHLVQFRGAQSWHFEFFWSWTK